MRKIIDGHVHLFPAGLPGTKDPAVGVTYGQYGRMWFSDGTPFQKMPLLLRDSCFDAEMLIQVMESERVERAVILQGGSPAFASQTAQAVSAYSGRLCGAMVPDFTKADPADEVRKSWDAGLHILKFDLHSDMGLLCPARFPKLQMDSEPVRQVLAEAEKLHMTVSVDAGPVMGNGCQLEAFQALVLDFPALRFVFCHLGTPPSIHAPAQQGASERWHTFLRLAERENVWFDIAALPEITGEGEYPCRSCAKDVRNFIDWYGAEKPIWGSDIPTTLSNLTYHQMISIYENSGLFSEAELDKIFYGNALAAYG